MLVISRPGISSTEITEFPLHSRFIKLPIENYLKLLPTVDPITYKKSTAWDQINGPQLALINCINSPRYRFVCAALARRLGKTFIANIIAQLVVLVPGSNVLVMSPNFSLSSISFELQRMLVKTFDLEITKDNAKDRVLELANGSTVRVGSISTVDSCVGRSYTLILFDEAALGKDAEEAFNVSLRPTLDRPDSKCIFISTPRGKNNFFSRFYQRGFSDEFPQWASITATYHENPRMSEVDVEEARRSMSKALFEQEYLSSFSTFEGQIYQGYLPEYTKEFEHKEGMEYIGGVDVGFRDPTAFVVISYDNNSGIFHVLEDYVQAGVTTSVHAKVFQDAIDKYGIESIFIDSAAAQTAADLSFTYNIGTIKAKKSILDGIAYVQALIEHGKLNVSPNCLDTLAMLDQYKWKTDAVSGVEKPDHDKYSHAADALRYALYSFTTGY